MSLCWKCKVGLEALGCSKETIELADKESSKRETVYCSRCGRQRKARKNDAPTEFGFDYHTLPKSD